MASHPQFEFIRFIANIHHLFHQLFPRYRGLMMVTIPNLVDVVLTPSIIANLYPSRNVLFLFLPYGSFPIRRLYQRLLRRWGVEKGAMVRL